MEKYYGIQYLRGIAALLVIVYHSMVMSVVAPYFNSPIGKFGVDIFFVISGFVMWVTTESKANNTLSFWMSRILRVVPLYWVFTLSIVCAAILVPSLFFNSRGLDFLFVIKSFLLIPTLNPDIGDITPAYTIGWTLVYEMFFYFIFGFSLFLMNLRKRFAFIFVLVGGLACCGMIFNFKGPILSTYTNSIMLEFLAGVGLGYFRTYLLKASVKVGVGLVILSFTVLLTCDADQSSRFWIYGIPSLMLVAGVVSLEKYIKLHISKLPLFFGEISYSLYLSHPISQRVWYVVFVLAFGQILNKNLALYYFVGSVFVGVLGGVVCYYVLEKQLLRLGRLKVFLKRPVNAVV